MFENYFSFNCQLQSHAHAQWWFHIYLDGKMAAAMDVDTPSGTNSGGSKKRFEVKKVTVKHDDMYI